jgi:hypothetical protein
MYLHGFYIAPNVSFIEGSGDNFDVQSESFQQVETLSAGVLAGWQLFPESHFSLGLAIGLDLYIPLNNNYGPDYFAIVKTEGESLSPVARFDFGYAW